MKVENGNTVKVDYEGSFDDGKIFDSSNGKEPLEFQVGKHMVIKGFEQAVLGMEKGGEKTIKISAEEGYGKRNEQLVQKVPKEKIPVKEELKPGMMLFFHTPEGQKIGCVITEVGAKEVTVDLNHPLAGKNLNFKIKVVEIKK